MTSSNNPSHNSADVGIAGARSANSTKHDTQNASRKTTSSTNPVQQDKDSRDPSAPTYAEVAKQAIINEESESFKKPKTIAIIGAGLVGCAAALAFAKTGYKVRVYEGRPDARTPEQREIFSFRSINMAVSARGILTLDTIDPEMSARVLKNLIPMYGRMIHDDAGNEISQKYGLYGEAINSIDRAELNRGLLDELDKAGVETFFNYKLAHASFSPKNKLTFSVAEESEGHDNKEQEKTGKSKTDSFKNMVVVDDVDVVIGCDGAHSSVRTHLGKYVRLNYNQEYIDSAYVELRIEPKPTQNGYEDSDEKFRLDKNHLHIWPRHNYMLIALPNMDGSFTSTLFAPWSIFNKELTNEEKWLDFFHTNFSEVFEKKLMTKEMLARAYHENPRGSLVCVRCSPYNYSGNVILLGDAAHSMVPFYGQGMNCGFEDVRILVELLEKNNFNFEAAFNEYTKTRNKDLNAIVDLAMRNYVEMRHDVVSRSYLIRKKLDGILSTWLGNYWLPLYTMVTFRPDISYSEALSRENSQAKILKDLVFYGASATVVTGCLLIGKALRKVFS